MSRSVIVRPEYRRGLLDIAFSNTSALSGVGWTAVGAVNPLGNGGFLVPAAGGMLRRDFTVPSSNVSSHLLVCENIVPLHEYSGALCLTNSTGSNAELGLQRNAGNNAWDFRTGTGSVVQSSAEDLGGKRLAILMQCDGVGAQIYVNGRLFLSTPNLPASALTIARVTTSTREDNAYYTCSGRYLFRASWWQRSFSQPEAIYLTQDPSRTADRVLVGQKRRIFIGAAGATNTNIAPGPGALTLAGYAPSVSVPIAVSPGVGALAIAGVEPTVGRSWQNPDALTVNTGSVVSGALYDTYTANDARLVLAEATGTPGFSYDFTYNNVPENAARTVNFEGYYSGNAPHVVKIQQYNYTTTGWVNLTADTRDLPSGAADTDRHFALLGSTSPYWSGGQVKLRIVHTSAGNVTHQLLVDEFVLTSTITANTGESALELTGYAPSARQTWSVSPGLGELSVTGYAPAVSIETLITAGVGELAFTGLAPSVTVSLSVATASGELSITATAPAVGQTYSVAPAEGALQLVGHAPGVAVSAAGVVNTLSGALEISAYAPAVGQTYSITPAVGELALTAFAPAVTSTESISVATDAGALAIAGYAPTVTFTEFVNVYPRAGQIVIASAAPSVELTGVAVYAYIDAARAKRNKRAVRSRRVN